MIHGTNRHELGNKAIGSGARRYGTNSTLNLNKMTKTYNLRFDWGIGAIVQERKYPTGKSHIKLTYNFPLVLVRSKYSTWFSAVYIPPEIPANIPTGSTSSGIGMAVLFCMSRGCVK